jgi:hypothetical protein
MLTGIRDNSKAMKIVFNAIMFFASFGAMIVMLGSLIGIIVLLLKVAWRIATRS